MHDYSTLKKTVCGKSQHNAARYQQRKYYKDSEKTLLPTTRISIVVFKNIVRDVVLEGGPFACS